MTVQYTFNNRGERLAYVHIEGRDKTLPAVLFLGGFKSDMQGTKALFLQAFCALRGQEFVRFDYAGHGQSEGSFVDGTVGLWADDAMVILDKVIQGEVILVGSSMGGWIALLLLLRYRERVKALVGIAAAPDFTRDIESKMSPDEHQEMLETGRLEVPNEYSDEPYIFTQALLDDGEKNSLLDREYDLDVPIVLLQGKLDQSVEWGKALAIQACFGEGVVKVKLIDDGDHSLSRSEDLEMLREAIKQF